MRLALWLSAFLAALYLADWTVASVHPHFETVHVERFLAFREKFNKISYERTDPRDERCLYALLPHSGMRPCWYVMWHRSEIVNVN